MTFYRTRVALGTIAGDRSIAFAATAVFAAGRVPRTAVVTANDNATPTAGKVWVRALPRIS